MNESVNGNNENEEKLIINIGEAYRPVVEDYERAKESMFKPIYEKGRNIVKEICEAYDDKNSTNECNTNIENYNNIIAFIGERGSGKTSSMLTFSDLLNNEEFLRSGLSKKAYDKDRIEFKFVQNDVIDPSQFDKNVNILEIILAGMFKNFKNKADKIESTDRQIIIECFDKVYRNLKTLKKESNSIYDGEVLEALLEMSASMEIKENLSKLIAVYLEKVETTSNKNSILVIRIDDIDLNTEHAHSMVEQLRKYLMLPRVIILMALKIDQLHDVVNQTHYISLAELAKMEKNDGSTNCISINDKVIDMTEKYLSKLFPIDHRLLMPEPAIFSSSKKFQINMKIENKTIVENYPSLDYGIRELIYKKTGLHFIKPDKNENPIVPSNLRELVNFVHYLKKFEDVKITSKEKLIRCMNAIIKNESGNKILDDEIQKKLQANGKTLEDFSWFLDCPLDENFDDWEVLFKENKVTTKLNLFEIDDNNSMEIYNKLRGEINRINEDEKERNYDNLDKKQLEKFKNYFLSYWCQNKVSRDGQLLITRFLALDTRKRNKFVILELEKIFSIAELLKEHIDNIAMDNSKFNSNTRTLQNLEKYLENYIQVSTIVNYEANVSLGDVLYTLSILEKLNISKEVFNLIFAIKTIYYIELEILNLAMKSNVKKELLGDIDYLIGGEYFSINQKNFIPLESGKFTREVREIEFNKLEKEIIYIDSDKQFETLLFMSMMFKRNGRINENYRIKEEVFYDIHKSNKYDDKEKYILSIMSPLFNSPNIYILLKNEVYSNYSNLNKLHNIQYEKFITNIILLEYLFLEKISKISITKSSDIVTMCWNKFYENLRDNMIFYDGISYFSTFNMNFMRIFRNIDIKNIDILENKFDKLISNMELDIQSRRYLENYWNEHYLNIKKDISAAEEMELDVLNKYITEMNFFKINKTNTSSTCKEDLIDILKTLTYNKSEDKLFLLKMKEEELLQNNPYQKSLYAKKYYEEGLDYFNKKNYNKAIEFLNNTIELNPKDIICFLYLAYSYINRGNEGDYDEAIKVCNTAIELDSNNEYILNALGNAYYHRKNKGDLQEAINCFEIALKINNINSILMEDINKILSKCREELESVESQTEEPTETNLEDSEPKDNE